MSEFKLNKDSTIAEGVNESATLQFAVRQLLNTSKLFV